MTTTHPSRSVEHAIAGYWRELLGIDAVQPTDHFIELGGDSVRATMLANRIEDDLGVRPRIVELFATLAEVARHCEELLAAERELARGGA
ncbi:MAG TPA: phosphopantetheine-binding protein [Kofleriaceae bacterium]|nr:phosphopantetheine-binding protein [Kofleriaceae bacterium]